VKYVDICFSTKEEGKGDYFVLLRSKSPVRIIKGKGERYRIARGLTERQSCKYEDVLATPMESECGGGGECEDIDYECGGYDGGSLNMGNPPP
jgi:hypothetical protein